ncbi:hypothetical protein EDB92DRAFT_2114806 [Lactarius akahatsu]|uniref:Tail specific protease domain-containing protein n=1 Tax=Lactarius akahatsu TaxID=416441 RepID=A0AAD4QDF5_9AGAM|nr:hypothetical protein EDB92DRAFT_2114806 [Lactarius akahatsu]
MLFSRFVRSGLLPVLLSRGLLATAAPDPCAKVAGLQFADPADAIACQKSFPFNETLRQNVLTVVSRVFDFFTFEDFYLNSPSPFQESTTNIRADIARINSTHYATDYDFNRDLWDFTTQLNDGHTRWFPNCYNSYQNLLPAPIVILDKGIFITPDAVEFLNQLGPGFIAFFAAKKFNWQRLAGAKVLTIGGLPASVYIDNIARTVSGNYLDHNVRVNSVVSSYRIVNTDFSQRLGDLAGPLFLTQTSLKFSLIPVNSTTPEVVDVPFVSDFIGAPFTDGPSYWANNCAANDQTNGVDLRSGSSVSRSQPRLARAALMDPAGQPKTAVGLPGPFLPNLPPTNGSTGVIKSFILPGNKTGVMFVGSFEGDFAQFPLDVDAAVKQFKASGVTNLLIDVTNNGGGFVCLGLFLHLFLSGSQIGLPGFQSTSRANPLAQKIVKAGIEQGHDDTISFYTPDNWLFLNGTQMPLDFDYNDPFSSCCRKRSQSADFSALRGLTTWLFLSSSIHVVIRTGVPDPNVTIPTTPPFDLNKVAIIGNGNCASTCSLFTTLMFERHQTKIAVFGGNPLQQIQYKGMAGNQVLEWADLDTEIKTAGLKNDPLAPPDLYGLEHASQLEKRFLDEKLPIAYVSEQPQFRFPYTAETYNNPQKVWLFA